MNKKDFKTSRPEATAQPIKRGRPAKTDPRFIPTADTSTAQFIWRPSAGLLERVRERASTERQSINITINNLVEFALNNLDYKKL